MFQSRAGASARLEREGDPYAQGWEVSAHRDADRLPVGVGDHELGVVGRADRHLRVGEAHGDGELEDARVDALLGEDEAHPVVRGLVVSVLIGLPPLAEEFVRAGDLCPDVGVGLLEERPDLLHVLLGPVVDVVAPGLDVEVQNGNARERVDHAAVPPRSEAGASNHLSVAKFARVLHLDDQRLIVLRGRSLDDGDHRRHDPVPVEEEVLDVGERFLARRSEGEGESGRQHEGSSAWQAEW